MARYVPDRGDIVWLDMSPQAGHEQAGRRPALVLSPKRYNAKTSLAIFCPITSHIKRYPFEVEIPGGLRAQGVVLADQIKNLDWRARKASLICRLPSASVAEVLDRLSALLRSGET
jgi:mRNA interferase MazF